MTTKQTKPTMTRAMLLRSETRDVMRDFLEFARTLAKARARAGDGRFAELNDQLWRFRVSGDAPNLDLLQLLRDEISETMPVYPRIHHFALLRDRCDWLMRLAAEQQRPVYLTGSCATGTAKSSIFVSLVGSTCFCGRIFSVAIVHPGRDQFDLAKAALAEVKRRCCNHANTTISVPIHVRETCCLHFARTVVSRVQRRAMERASDRGCRASTINISMV